MYHIIIKKSYWSWDYERWFKLDDNQIEEKDLAETLLRKFINSYIKDIEKHNKQEEDK